MTTLPLLSRGLTVCSQTRTLLAVPQVDNHEDSVLGGGSPYDAGGPARGEWAMRLVRMPPRKHCIE